MMVKKVAKEVLEIKGVCGNFGSGTDAPLYLASGMEIPEDRILKFRRCCKVT